MPSTPHLSAQFAVFALSLFLTIVATGWAMAERGFPGEPLRWPSVFVRLIVGRLRTRNRETVYWIGIGVYAVVVSAMHFGGIQYNIYTTVHWWDLLTHALSGFGVAGVLYLTFHRPVVETRSPRWLVPAVLAFGGGFEVYEFVFKDFWYTWSFRYYLVDTVVDLLSGVAGAVVFVALVATYRWLGNRRRRTATR